MILKSRAFQRREPSRDAKLFIIYCEGSRREPDYFRYFSEISSNIRLEVVEADSQGNNSPLGLYEAACQDLYENETGFLSPKYQLDGDDEVWFIIDTDQWGEDIEKLRLHCESESSWKIVQSNPCFEVWLYYHVETTKPDFPGFESSTNWKSHLGKIISGGFDSRKHPILIADAIRNSKQVYDDNGKVLSPGLSEVHLLASRIYPFIRTEIEKARLLFNSRMTDESTVERE